MLTIEPELLVPVIYRLTGDDLLTPAEQAEALRMAQGLVCKDAAAATGISPETVRARRKRIYRKLHVAGLNEYISALLAVSLVMLAQPKSAATVAPPAPG